MVEKKMKDHFYVLYLSIGAQSGLFVLLYITKVSICN